MKLLIAEDNRDISRALYAIFSKEGFSVDTVFNGKDAFDYALLGNYDGIILDIMMPEKSGIEVLTELRSQNINTPILMLTAKGEIEDRVQGLNAGADDYLPKPFAVSELIARVRAMLRRRSDFHPDTIKVGNISMNRGTPDLNCEGKSIRLVTREYQVMEILMDNVGKAISTETFLERIWGWDSDIEVNIVWVTISNLRKKLQTLNASVSIRAIRGIGYLLEVDS